jgi:hypothetical protein
MVRTMEVTDERRISYTLYMAKDVRGPG